MPTTGVQRTARQRARKKARLGSGERFAALSRSLEAKGADNPKALAAWIGARRWGRSKMQKMAAAGRKG